MGPRRQRRRKAQAPVLDLRGVDVERALRLLDQWLERGFLRGTSYGTVVCGWGKGRVLSAVSEKLDTHRLVAGYRSNGPELIVEIVPRTPDF
jgi:dsDNA-specific endonuclease/ATPase MutS2